MGVLLFDEGIKAWDDWELAMRMRDVTGFCHTEEPLFIQDQRRASGAGMWDNESLFANDLGIIMRKHGARWEKNPRVAARHYRIMAQAVREACRTGLDRKLFANESAPVAGGYRRSGSCRFGEVGPR